VKCDEAKPFCQRCLKWQGFCDGYESAASASSATLGPTSGGGITKPTKRPTNSLVVQDLSMLAEPKDAALLFANDMEKNYFDAWQILTNILHGGFFKDDFWKRTIPQLSREHASIRYAAMAIGAVGSAVRPRLEPLTPAELRARGPHYDEALMFYNKAIREVRNATVNESSLRAAIVCCILFICFESLHGDGSAALAHIAFGQKMMDELMQKSEAEVKHGLGDENLEMETLHVFQRLILQSWSCGVVRPRKNLKLDPTDTGAAWCCRGGSRNKLVIDKMPDNFDDMNDARRWWHVTHHYVIHRSNIAFQVHFVNAPEEEQRENEIRIQEQLEPVHSSAEFERGTEPYHMSIPEHQDHYHQCLQRWYSRFRPMYDKARQHKKEDQVSYLQAINLQVQYLGIYTCIQAPLAADLETAQAMTPHFREIVRLCRQILEQQPKLSNYGCQEVFTMDTGPMWVLSVTSHRCRDAAVRREAIDLLLDNPRRDGIWDSRILAAAALRNEIHEEENASEGTAAEQWKRLRHRGGIVREDGIMRVRALMKDKETGEWVMKEDSIMPFLPQVQERAMKFWGRNKGTAATNETVDQ
jgi:hypothetical protein